MNVEPRYCSLHPSVVQFVERNQEMLAGAFSNEQAPNSGVLRIITSLSAPFRRVQVYERVSDLSCNSRLTQ